MTWHQAKVDCEARGGHLVAISSKEENNFIRNLAGSQNIWIGLTDEIYEGSWQWVNGGNLTYTNWDSEEPNDSGIGEDYVMMYYNGSWNDAGPPGTPDEVYPYVCEWEEDLSISSESSTSTFESQSFLNITPGFQLFSWMIFLSVYILTTRIYQKLKERY